MLLLFYLTQATEGADSVEISQLILLPLFAHTALLSYFCCHVHCQRPTSTYQMSAYTSSTDHRSWSASARPFAGPSWGPPSYYQGRGYAGFPDDDGPPSSDRLPDNWLIHATNDSMQDSLPWISPEWPPIPPPAGCSTRAMSDEARFATPPSKFSTLPVEDIVIVLPRTAQGDRWLILA